MGYHILFPFLLMTRKQQSLTGAHAVTITVCAVLPKRYMHSQDRCHLLAFKDKSSHWCLCPSINRECTALCRGPNVLYCAHSKLINVLPFHCGLSVLSSTSSFCNVLVRKKANIWKRHSPCGNFFLKKWYWHFYMKKRALFFFFFTMNVDVLLWTEFVWKVWKCFLCCPHCYH